MGRFSRLRFGRLADSPMQSLRGIRARSCAETTVQKDRSLKESQKMREIYGASLYETENDDVFSRKI